MTVSLASMFRELNSFIPCDQYFADADRSGVTTRNNKDLKEEVRLWANGTYDEDPQYLVFILINILEHSKNKSKKKLK